MSLFKGEISVQDLIFNSSLNDRMNFPFKLKYGQLGKLEVKVQNLLSMSKQSVSMKVSEVFLCFETLELGEWNKDTILSKYQELKKHLLA